MQGGRGAWGRRGVSQTPHRIWLYFFAYLGNGGFKNPYFPNMVKNGKRRPSSGTTPAVSPPCPIDRHARCNNKLSEYLGNWSAPPLLLSLTPLPSSLSPND